jgi:Zn-dependent M28 family amino/carboxypeptidase
MKTSHFGIAAVASGLLLGALLCTVPVHAQDAPASAIDADELGRHTQTLASDAFEGRAPSSPGGAKTVQYLTEQFRRMGLEPGNGDAYTQDVPLVSVTATRVSSLTVAGEDGASTFSYMDEYMAWTKRLDESVALDASDLVFVGYGIDAPEYDWNDYAGLDVAGKTVVMLVNDPGFATGDADFFKGREMTYYGRWTYKFAEAARQGARAAFIVHETEPAGYPWEVVSGSWSGPQFDLASADQPRAAVEGWLTRETAEHVFAKAGLDYEEMKQQAARRDFEAVPMDNLHASVALENRIERTTSQNVIARVPGSERPDECVAYMAHWDHLGRDSSREGDQIYNGALDNATGTAGLLELAQAFASMEERPARTVQFIAVTAEEAGLLGSAHYVEHPTCALAQTAAVLNMDGLNVLGPMNDLTVVGYGQSELDDYLARAAGERTLRPDPEPEKGFYFRSDHFNFAKKGVPALYTDTGVESVEHGEEWARAQREEYTRERYHKVGDEYDPDWDLSGAVQDLRLLYRVGARIAGESRFPEWKEGSAFKAVREEMTSDAGE